MKALPGILIGLAAGVVLGVLMAPDKGNATRKRISNDADSFFKDLQDQLQEGIETIKGQYNDFVETSASRTKDALGRAERRAKR
ncbi:YtxH domain-containing protein [Rudanella paleaurantiibacter]|uniref:YtxH domain-containing protein n=1 Tax=Rudanella paleaurantiibacter TaxID=2614655 RepID=A0A7J5U3Q1_9BACT|nr:MULTISPECIES: YtxH domain-containing protein [Rudanella]KAB7732472.1 YtxH domain-containing protein [Rudanella paleaurantiibacter]